MAESFFNDVLMSELPSVSQSRQPPQIFSTPASTPAAANPVALSFTSPAVSCSDNMFDFGDDDNTLSGNEPTLHAPHAVNPFEPSERARVLERIRSQVMNGNGYFNSTHRSITDTPRKNDVITLGMQPNSCS